VNNNMIENLKQGWLDSHWVNYRKFTYTYIPTGIEQLADGIETYSLSNNFPNPFNPTTNIKYQIPEISFVTLKIYDVLGNEIANLVSEEKRIGNYEIEFNASKLPSGVYFYRLQAGSPSAGLPAGRHGSGQSFVETKKMVLMK